MNEFNWEISRPSEKGTVTLSGREVLYNEINPTSNISIDDIAHALSLQNRFIGHVRHPYSVAQHCLNCVTAAKEYYYAYGRDYNFLLHLLLHDAAEAYIGDIISPVKKMLYAAIRAGAIICDKGNYPEYSAIFEEAINMEARLNSDIARAFSLQPLSAQQQEAIREIDARMCATESSYLCFRQIPKQAVVFDLPQSWFNAFNYDVIRAKFLACFRDLCNKRAAD